VNGCLASGTLPRFGVTVSRRRIFACLQLVVRSRPALRSVFPVDTPQVGSLLPLNDVRTAHEMLAGAPHKRGKIALEVNG